MDKALKAFLNTLRCPLCGSLIDMFEGKTANFACASDSKHYRLLINTDVSSDIIMEYLEVVSGKHRYDVVQHRLNSTTIHVFNVNGDGIVNDFQNVKTFKFNKSLFNFKNVGKEKLINKIKTILVFQ